MILVDLTINIATADRKIVWAIVGNSVKLMNKRYADEFSIRAGGTDFQFFEYNADDHADDHSACYHTEIWSASKQVVGSCDCIYLPQSELAALQLVRCWPSPAIKSPNALRPLFTQQRP